MLRAWAAVSVMVFHYTLGFGASGESFPVIYALQVFGFAGVDIFFVISGYIITHTWLTSGRSPGGFLIRRVLRIYCGYWIALGGFVLAHTLFGQSLADYGLWQAVFMLPQPFMHNPLQVIWTLHHELFYYTVFAALMFCPPLWRRNIAAILCASMLAMFTIYWWQGYFASLEAWKGLWIRQSVIWNTIFSPFALEFAAGAALCLLRKRPRFSGFLLGLAMVGFIGAGISNAAIFEGKLGGGYHVFQRVMLLLLPSVLLVAWAVREEYKPSGRYGRMLVHIGDASYMLYLLHLPVLAVCQWLDSVVMRC